MMKYVMAALLAAACLAPGCTPAYEPIDYGKDACAHCKMTIMDARFAAEIVTPKGKVYKFDDISCMRALTTELPGSMLFVNDYTAGKAAPLNAATAVYLHHESFGSPMNGNLAAFSRPDKAKPLQDSLQLELLNWETLP
ncbi:nitrous oxide reductase accessory protein NosL [Chitinophaga alhagiae]|uniref:nitrous oxide reductase accessory protein NosL n=1 Tax=Chitinophaga alhagiae TaxID=2203219 RepID=UPI000E5AFBDB|nr:nitrous oxide reductase accessory protein NosL [Chitinophaga alhagiae]